MQDCISPFCVSPERLKAIIAPLEKIIKSYGFAPSRKPSISGPEIKGYFRNGSEKGASLAISYWLLVLSDNGGAIADIVHKPNLAELEVKVYVYGTRRVKLDWDGSYIRAEPIEEEIKENAEQSFIPYIQKIVAVHNQESR